VLDELGKSDRYFPEELRATGFVKTEATRELRIPGTTALTAGRKAESGMREAIQNLNAKLSDNIPRRAAWYAVARRHNQLLNRIEGTNRTLDEFLTEMEQAANRVPVFDLAKTATPEERAAIEKVADALYTEHDAELLAIQDQLVQQVLDTLVDFGDLNHFERSVIRRIFPFYSWIKGATKATVRLAVQHPAKAEILSILGHNSEDDIQKLIGRAQKMLVDFLPAGAQNKAGEITGLTTAGTNPWKTFADVWRFVVGAASRQLDTPADNLFTGAGPVPTLALEAATRRDLYTGQELTSQYGLPGIFGEAAINSIPEVASAKRIISPELPHTKSGDPRLTVPGASYDVAGVHIPSELARFLGAPVKTVNVNAADTLYDDRATQDLTPAQRHYRQQLAADVGFWREHVGQGRMAKPLQDQLLWKLRLDEAMAKAADAQGLDHPGAQAAAVVLVGIVSHMHPEAAPQLQAALQTIQQQGGADPLYQSFTDSLRSAIFKTLDEYQAAIASVDKAHAIREGSVGHG
jgi:hypothetical protein